MSELILFAVEVIVVGIGVVVAIMAVVGLIGLAVFAFILRDIDRHEFDDIHSEPEAFGEASMYRREPERKREREAEPMGA